MEVLAPARRKTYREIDDYYNLPLAPLKRMLMMPCRLVIPVGLAKEKNEELRGEVAFYSSKTARDGGEEHDEARSKRQ